jgi:hypothetical protein
MYFNQNNFSEDWIVDAEDADGMPSPNGIPDIIDRNGDDLQVTEAFADDSQQLRIIFDELLNGETVEQFVCACADDCPNMIEASLDPTACDDNPDTQVNEQGQFLDTNADGLPDLAQSLAGIVTITCNDADANPIPVYTAAAGDGFYNPSGNQDVPVATGLAGLGPAVVMNVTTGLRTDSDCKVALGADVKDKDGQVVPALPADKSFHTQKLKFLSTPADAKTGVDVKPNVNLAFNALIDKNTLTGIKIDKDAAGTITPVPATVTLLMSGTSVDIDPTADLELNTKYVVTVPATVADQHGGKLPAEVKFSFTTKAM